MTIGISNGEAAILLGATLMHWGVPFHTVAKSALTEQEQAMVDEASDKLISLREMYQHSQVQAPQDIYLSAREAALLIAVVENCLHECGDDPVELDLQLHTNERAGVETLLDRLRPLAVEQAVKLA